MRNFILNTVSLFFIPFFTVHCGKAKEEPQLKALDELCSFGLQLEREGSDLSGDSGWLDVAMTGQIPEDCPQKLASITYGYIDPLISLSGTIGEDGFRVRDLALGDKLIEIPTMDEKSTKDVFTIETAAIGGSPELEKAKGSKKSDDQLSAEEAYKKAVALPFDSRLLSDATRGNSGKIHFKILGKNPPLSGTLTIRWAP